MTAVTVGALAFAAGFFGPMFFSDSNLGPLLGIFITGPLGFLFGALLGVVRAIIKAQGRVGQRVVVWYLLIFYLALFYYLLLGSLFLFGGIASLGLAMVLVLTGAVLLTETELRKKLPDIAKSCGAIILVSAVVMIAMAIFPPVAENSWFIANANLPDAANREIPAYAFFQDSRFESSRVVPEFVIDKKQLALQWFLTSAVVALFCRFVKK